MVAPAWRGCGMAGGLIPPLHHPHEQHAEHGSSPKHQQWREPNPGAALMGEAARIIQTIAKDRSKEQRTGNDQRDSRDQNASAAS